MNAERLPSLTVRSRVVTLILFGVLVMVVLAIKSCNDSWFEPQTPLVTTGQPVLVFFILEDGCECQMVVIHSAEAQLADWPFMQTGVFSVLRVDFNHRLDLAQQYGVVRAPALVLLDSLGQVVWKQDLSLADDAPLDLVEAQSQVEKLLSVSR